MTQLPIDLPPSDDDLMGRTTCGCAGCDKSIRQSRAIHGIIRIGQTLHHEHFCSYDCRDEWRDYMMPGVRYDEH